LVFSKMMRFVEGDYCFIFNAIQMGVPRLKRGKRKKKGTIIRQGHPWSVQQVTKEKEKPPMKKM
jgi:hypothetical protein